MSFPTNTEIISEFGDAIRAFHHGQNRFSVQGFGMFRLYIGNTYRLHVWSRHFRGPEVSDIHTHPWSLTSRIISGAMCNKVFEEHPDSPPTHLRQKLKCGPSGGLEEDPKEVSLRLVEESVYRDGDCYSVPQGHIHKTIFRDGTITITDRRIPEGVDPDYAYVFWGLDEQWGTAEPRPATGAEVNLALERFQVAFG